MVFKANFGWKMAFHKGVFHDGNDAFEKPCAYKSDISSCISGRQVSTGCATQLPLHNGNLPIHNGNVPIHNGNVPIHNGNVPIQMEINPRLKMKT